jgi:hypothetical protein
LPSFVVANHVANHVANDVANHVAQHCNFGYIKFLNSDVVKEQIMIRNMVNTTFRKMKIMLLLMNFRI